MVRRVKGAVAAMAVAALLLVATPADAARGARWLNEADLRKLGLQLKDVPAALKQGKKKMRSGYLADSRALGPFVCDSGGAEPLYGPQPQAESVNWLQSKASTGTPGVDGQKTKWLVRSSIYQYGSAKAAKRAYKKTAKQIRKCRLHVDEKQNIPSIGPYRVRVDYRSHRNKKLYGLRGVTLEHVSRDEGGGSGYHEVVSNAGSYQTSYRARASIVTVTLMTSQVTENPKTTSPYGTNPAAGYEAFVDKQARKLAKQVKRAS